MGTYRNNIIKRLADQFGIFCCAVVFFSRIPLPSFDANKARFAVCIKFLPAVGGVIGGLCAAVFLGSSSFLPLGVSVLLSLVSGVLLTGAMHEDGFADFCDGFGGGFSRERILEIMKDSSIGLYGALGVFAMLALKYAALVEMPAKALPFAIVSGFCASRWAPVCIAYFNAYARKGTGSKAEFIAQPVTASHLAQASILPAVLCIWAGPPAIIAFAAPLAIAWLMPLYTNKKIGGYTGDTQGAAQQISEVLFYLVFLAAEYNAASKSTFWGLLN
jgi:adenosylcobinamide-GDP ribazoletransferase